MKKKILTVTLLFIAMCTLKNGNENNATDYRTMSDYAVVEESLFWAKIIPPIIIPPPPVRERLMESVSFTTANLYLNVNT